MSLDFTTPRDQIRLLVSDTNEAAFVFSAAELDAFLALESDGVKRAAALALETLASNEVMVSKVITDNGLSTNGAAVSAELRRRAADLRSQAEDDAGFFDVAEFDVFGSPEYVGSQGFFPHEPF